MAATSTPPVFVASGAEALLRIDSVGITAERAELTAESGRWLADPVAGCVRGALGVPLDDVTGYVVAAGAASGRWPVSLGIRVDYLADPTIDGGPMAVTGELVARDRHGGTTRGRVVDAAGGTIALVTQRSHLVDIAETPTDPSTSFDVPPPHISVREVLGLNDIGCGIVAMPPNVFAANGMGNVHGGVLIIGSELAAMSAIDADGDLRTTSIDIAYVRPGDARGTTIFRAEVIHRGRSLAVIRVAAANSSGRPCSLATVIVQRLMP